MPLTVTMAAGSGLPVFCQFLYSLSPVVTRRKVQKGDATARRRMRAIRRRSTKEKMIRSCHRLEHHLGQRVVHLDAAETLAYGCLHAVSIQTLEGEQLGMIAMLDEFVLQS